MSTIVYELITISRKQAKNAWMIELDKDYLVISENAVIQKGNMVEILSQGIMEEKKVMRLQKVKIYPKIIKVF